MKKKRNLNNLVEFRNLIQSTKHLEKQSIDELLKWRKKLLKKTKFKTKLVNFDSCKDWYFDKNNNITHKSGQFFQVKAANIKGASKREVKSWSQPILTQKHGGILAFISRFTKKNGVEFLLEGKTEPGDDSDIKFAASFQATQSNINRAHGGKIPKFHDIVVQRKGSKLIYVASHNEEGARFWKKSNLNVIVQLNDPDDKRIKGENYKWASLSQIKKLGLKDNLVTPYVKTILFMI
jgi:oxidase EvaA